MEQSGRACSGHRRAQGYARNASQQPQGPAEADPTTDFELGSEELQPPSLHLETRKWRSDAADAFAPSTGGD